MDAQKKLKETLEKQIGVIEDITSVGSVLPGKAGDISRITNLAVNLANKNNERKVKNLLLGMNQNDNFDTEAQLNQLSSYAKDPERAQYIVELFQKALLSNSIIAIILMGRQWSRIHSQERKLSQKDMIVFSALSELNDYDIRNFISICDHIRNSPINGKYFNIKIVPEENREMMEYSLQKLYRLQLFDMDSPIDEGNGNLNFGSFYKSNNVTDELLEIINASRGLLNYYHLLFD